MPRFSTMQIAVTQAALTIPKRGINRIRPLCVA
jgi:hypothetical protein